MYVNWNIQLKNEVEKVYFSLLRRQYLHLIWFIRAMQVIRSKYLLWQTILLKSMYFQQTLCFDTSVWVVWWKSSLTLPLWPVCQAESSDVRPTWLSSQAGKGWKSLRSSKALMNTTTWWLKPDLKERFLSFLREPQFRSTPTQRSTSTAPTVSQTVMTACVCIKQ